MNLQSKVIDHIVKGRVHDNTPVVREIADVLSISLDSAYRRLRGDTDLTANELEKLCVHYSISIDSLLNQNAEMVSFTFRGTNTQPFSYSHYLEMMIRDLQRLEEYKQTRIIYDAKDIPIFYHFVFPELAEFKGLFWEKTVYQNTSSKKKYFCLDSLDERNIDMGNKIFQLYCKIASIEIWNDEVLNSLLSQIRYYHESGFIQSRAVTEKLLTKVLELIDHLEYQAESGSKMPAGNRHDTTDGNFQLYYNEVVIGYNSLLLEYDEKREFHIGHNIINTLICNNKDFCDFTYEQKRKMLGHSILISTTAGKERTKFFNRLRKKTHALHHELQL